MFDEIYKSESRRVLATLIRLLGDFDLAEDALHEAFRAAMEQWPAQGIPENPYAWLVSAGRFKAIDRIRKQSRINTPLDEIGDVAAEVEEYDEKSVEDDQLRSVGASDFSSRRLGVEGLAFAVLGRGELAEAV
jgi:RNA polymerase sigma-70 factor (ECF subfamily)